MCVLQSLSCFDPFWQTAHHLDGIETRKALFCGRGGVGGGQNEIVIVGASCDVTWPELTDTLPLCYPALLGSEHRDHSVKVGCCAFHDSVLTSLHLSGRVRFQLVGEKTGRMGGGGGRLTSRTGSQFGQPLSTKSLGD